MLRKIIKAFLKTIPGIAFLILFALIGQKATACDADDELPGALPPAPNGGELGEADHVDKALKISSKETEGKTQLYWEGVHLKDKRQVHLTLIAALPPKTAVFTVLSPTKEFSDLAVQIEDPRKQHTFKVPFTVKEDRIVIDFDARKLNRFIVHVFGNRPDGAREALVQIEEE